MKVAVIGCGGQCGSAVVDELLLRGHTVVGLSRNPPETWNENDPKYSAISVNIQDTRRLTEVFSSGFDSIVCSFAPPLTDFSILYELGVEGHAKIKTALLASQHTGSFIVIGGAGSLHSSEGHQLCEEKEFAFSWWMSWPIVHLDYMRERSVDHGNVAFSRFIWGFKWARTNIEKPGWYSWLFRPFAHLYLRQAKKMLTSRQMKGLITLSRVALVMWEGVRDKQWTFLSPPGLLRDKGQRTGKYELLIDDGVGTDKAFHDGIYNEDMAVAIVDEVEQNKLAFKHWTCIGPIGLGKW